MAEVPTAESFITLLGGFPVKPPLTTQTLHMQDCGLYTQTLLEYATEGDERVQAYLLTPHQATTSAPGVIAIHQDGSHRPYEYGKSEPAGVAGDAELAYGRELCLRGYVVLCPDRFPFESRRLALSPFNEQFAAFRIFTEHGVELTEDLYVGCVANRLLLEEGRMLLGKHLFDLSRAVDCLVARPEVDPRRVGVIGHSAGGFLAALLMYVDERLHAGCASCGTFLYRHVFTRDSLRPINGFGGVGAPGLARWGDLNDVRAGLAPRAFLDTSGDRLSPPAVADLTDKARQRFAALGVAERYHYLEHDGGHTFPPVIREYAYAWLDGWLGRL